MSIKTKIIRLKRKSFRDAFVSSHLTHGLAYQIQALRSQRGWTQGELAQKLKLKGQSAVARMEDPSYGRLSMTTLLKLSSVFDVALSVRFQSYAKFLVEREDVSPSALSVESFEVEIPRILEDITFAETSQNIDFSKSYHDVNEIRSKSNNFNNLENFIPSKTIGYTQFINVNAGENICLP